MTKTVHLTVTLKVELASEIERDYLLEQLRLHSVMCSNTKNYPTALTRLVT